MMRETVGLDTVLGPFDPGRDHELVAGWLDQPFVARWWGNADRGVAELAARDAGTVALIAYRGRSVGLLCWQVPLRTELAAVGLEDLPTDLVDVDFMIGDPTAIGRGIGPAALALLFARLRDQGVRTVGIATAQANARALRACLKAGLHPYRDFVEDGVGYRYLVRDLHEP